VTLRTFFRSDDLRASERVLGAYLYPFRTFSPTPPTEADYRDRLIEVVQTIPVIDRDVLVTRNAGLFTRPPGHLPDPFRDTAAIPIDNATFGEKLRVEEEVAERFNLVICELALLGIVSAPVTPKVISAAALIDGQALITSAAGGRESYADRVMGPARDLFTGQGLLSYVHHHHPLEVLERVRRLEKVTALRSVSTTIPTFVASAYALFSQRQLAEALASAWIVIEQFVDRKWSDYVATTGATGALLARLQDSRNNPVWARINTLRDDGVLPRTLCETIDQARNRRNRLMHRATIALDDARVVLLALHAVLEEICGQPSSPPECSSELNW
jgi:hypothetical protein